MISATAVTALWSAGRGMFSVARGLNRVNGRGRRHWYVFNRLICCGYTILFIAVGLMSMGLLVFGRTLQNFIQSHFPLIAPFNRHSEPAAPAVGRSYPSYFLFRDLLSGAGPEGERKSSVAGSCIFHNRLDAVFSCIFPVF